MVHIRTPWVFQDLVEELDRMSRNVGWAFGAPSHEGTLTDAGMEIDENEATLRLDLPGVAEADLELVLENDRLHIGARREDLHQENEEVLLRERTYGEFSQDLRLPWPVREEDVEASLKQGVLKLRLKRSPAAAPRQIKVKTQNA
jgi:HSP20 family molecular chaperone IbpA